jgi:hypothetical protein
MSLSGQFSKFSKGEEAVDAKKYVWKKRGDAVGPAGMKGREARELTKAVRMRAFPLQGRPSRVRCLTILLSRDYFFCNRLQAL